MRLEIALPIREGGYRSPRFVSMGGRSGATLRRQPWSDRDSAAEVLLRPRRQRGLAEQQHGDLVAEAPWSVAEWDVAPRFDNPRATVLVLVVGRQFWGSEHRKRL